MGNNVRLIDANALGRDAFHIKQYGKGIRCVVDWDDIEAAPTVDAVEVVRCRDCRWYQEGEFLAPNKFCFRLKHPKEDRRIGYNFSPDDFCSYGERKENE